MRRSQFLVTVGIILTGSGRILGRTLEMDMEVKLNIVLIKGVNDNEIINFV